MRRLLGGLLVGIGLCGLAGNAFAGEENCTNCGGAVQITGKFNHFKLNDQLPVTGTAPGAEAAFREDITGYYFTVTVPHLPAGSYRIVIGEAETFFSKAGERAFDIFFGDQKIRESLDIFAEAGGASRAVYFTNQLEHADDSLRGPLSLMFVARKDQAKFNTIEIKDTNGVTSISMKAADFANLFAEAAGKKPEVAGPVLWKDPAQPLEARVNDLISRLSLVEKVEQLQNATPGIPRLGIGSYDYWNESLHGVGRAGYATVFPQAIGMAATWDAPLVRAEADCIATEARAKYNDFTQSHDGDTARYYGLTFWTPNLNIFRDPRWGRGQETYGEDTFLTGELGVAFIRGLQGDDPKYVKAMACAKHFAVHSGPENSRHSFDVDPPERDFYETYLPHFEKAVRAGHVGGVMGAYNSLYGIPACASPLLLSNLLRGQWKFDGYVVSDCGAITDIFAHHKFADSPEAAAADAIKAGCDICCGTDYDALTSAVERGLVTEGDINRALAHALTTRFRLGLFDPPSQVPYAGISIAQNDTAGHEALALKVARESIVLLKNDGVLPLDRNKIKRITVIGYNANSAGMLVGNYNGVPSRPVTIWQGIHEAAGPAMEISGRLGWPLAVSSAGLSAAEKEQAQAAIEAAKTADVIIYVGGIHAGLEGEQMPVEDIGFDGGDRTRIELPEVQEEYLKQLQALGKPVVFVNCSGSAMAMPWEAEHLSAIVQAWYPGEEGGEAVAEVLFGDVNPAGRLPVTFYKSTDDLPKFDDYSMANRTYRYFEGKPLFPFGFGLSYTRFDYGDLKLESASLKSGDVLKLSLNLTNAGGADGDEVVQAYFRHVDSSRKQPKEALCGFARVHLPKKVGTRLKLEVPVNEFRSWDTAEKHYVVEPGQYELMVGASSADIRLRVPFTVVAEK